MPLVEPLPLEANPEVAELARFFHATLGFEPNSVLTMQRRPEIAKAFIALNQAVMRPDHGVSSGLKRLVGYVASLAAGCRYCQAHTALAAERFGVPEDKLAALWDYRSSPLYDDAERAALDFAAAAAAIPNAVDAEIAANLRRHWDDGQIVEILGVVALFGFLNRWNDSMATRLEAPAERAARQHLGDRGWQPGKHQPR